MEGENKYQTKQYETCPVCWGDGEVANWGPDSPVRKCVTCLGCGVLPLYGAKIFCIGDEPPGDAYRKRLAAAQPQEEQE
jgi:hypothetical protein